MNTTEELIRVLGQLEGSITGLTRAVQETNRKVDEHIHDSEPRLRSLEDIQSRNSGLMGIAKQATAIFVAVIVSFVAATIFGGNPFLDFTTSVKTETTTVEEVKQR